MTPPSEEAIRERMRNCFETAATGFGVGLTSPQMMEVMSYITFGTALAWSLGMDEDEVRDAVIDAATWVHRENPQQLESFLQGWRALG